MPILLGHQTPAVFLHSMQGAGHDNLERALPALMAMQCVKSKPEVIVPSPQKPSCKTTLEVNSTRQCPQTNPDSPPLLSPNPFLRDESTPRRQSPCAWLGRDHLPILSPAGPRVHAWVGSSMAGREMIAESLQGYTHNEGWFRKDSFPLSLTAALWRMAPVRRMSPSPQNRCPRV